VQRGAFHTDDLSRWRAAGVLAAGLAVFAWLAVIIAEVAVPETQFRAATWMQPVTVLAWGLGIAATAATAVVVPALIFPAVPRRTRIVLAIAATVAAAAPAVAVGDLDGFDARRYYDGHRTEFVRLVGSVSRGENLLPGLGRLSVDGTVDVTRVGDLRVIYVPQRTSPPAGYAWLDGVPPHGFEVPVSGGARPPRYPLGDGWWWVS
jgi:hypothetical protein